jgi:hypothetical protein
MADENEAAAPEVPAQQEVDNDPGVPIPTSEEQAEQLPDPPGEHAKAQEVARDETVVGNTDIPGTGGGTRFFGAEPQS